MRSLASRPVRPALILVLSTVALVAAGSGRATPSGAQVTGLRLLKPQIPVVRVTPSGDRAVTSQLRRLGVEVPATLAPRQALPSLSWNQRRLTLLDGGIEAPPAPPGEFRLSSRQAWRAGAGELVFIRPVTGYTPSDIVAFDGEKRARDDQGAVWLRFRVEGKARYIVEAEVGSATLPMTLTIAWDADQRVTVTDSPQRVPIVIDLTSAGNVNLMFLGDVEGWGFLGVLVTKLT